MSTNDDQDSLPPVFSSSLAGELPDGRPPKSEANRGANSGATSGAARFDPAETAPTEASGAFAGSPPPRTGPVKAARIHTGLCDGPIDIADLEDRARVGGMGALCYFEGIIRPDEKGERIAAMSYEAYTRMAENEMRKLAEEITDRWPIMSLVAEHRVGRVPAGQTAVVVYVAAGHRAEAFEACRYFIDEVKQRVPIWKSSPAGPGASEQR